MMAMVKYFIFVMTCAVAVSLLLYFSSRSVTIAKNPTPRPISRPLNVSEDIESILHRQYKPPLSYIVVLEYADQLGGAMPRFAQLLQLTAKWKRHGVEPFVLGSGLGIPRKGNLEGLLHLSDIYNLSSLELCAGNTTVSSFEDFLVNSPRELVLLNFVKGKKRDPSIYDCTGDQNVVTAFNVYLNSTNVKSKAIAEHGKNYTFKFVKAVCVEAQYSGFSLDDLERAVAAGSEHVRVPTVVIKTWIGLSNSPGTYNFYVKDSLQWSLKDDAVCNVDTLPRTPFILEATEEFKKSLSLSGPFVGIHFRIERLMKKEDEQQDGFLDECVERSGAVIRGVLRKYNVTSKNAIALNDYSDYGTFVCRAGWRRKCINLRNKIIKRLETWGVRTVSYDPALFNKPRHKGFVSLIEKETLSSADYLVTVGGGRYQGGIEHLFVT